MDVEHTIYQLALQIAKLQSDPEKAREELHYMVDLQCDELVAAWQQMKDGEA